MNLKLFAGAFLVALSTRLLVGQTLQADSVPVSVEVSGEWLAGTPLWIIARVENKTDHDIIAACWNSTPFSWGRVAFAIMDPATGKIVAEERGGFGVIALSEGSAQLPPFTLKAGTKATLPIRLRWPDADVKPGTYKLLVSFAANEPKEGFASTTVAIEIRSATAEEQKFMKRQCVGYAYPNQMFSEDPPADAPKSLRESMSMDWQLHKILLAKTPRTTATAPAQTNRTLQQQRVYNLKLLDINLISDPLPPFYDPIIGILKYELLFRQGNEAEAAKIKQEVLKKDEGLRWAFDSLQPEGGGFVLRWHPW
jgi:hypothetical protein